MELNVSVKTSSFSNKRPQIKKGFYPSKLVSIEERKDKEGNLHEGKFGKQLIMKFVIYKQDESGKPTEPMTFIDEIDGIKVEKEIILPKFVYHMYKNKDGTYSTAVTPNSAITKIFEALGWKFDGSKNLDVEQFIGKLVEVCLDDYEYEADGKILKASSIKDINKLEVQDEKNNNPLLKINENQELRIKELKKMLDNGHLTQKGYDMAVEQIRKGE